MTGYDGIIARANQAFSDLDVKGVLLDMDTPGGEVAGCFDTARTLRSLADSSGKPLWSLCYDVSCSAGMALASAAHRRLITQTGVAGSVGVIMAHASYEKQLQEEGVSVTLIHSGAHKAEGNPYQDLPAEVLARFQSGTDSLRLDFVTLLRVQVLQLPGHQPMRQRRGRSQPKPPGSCSFNRAGPFRCAPIGKTTNQVEVDLICPRGLNSTILVDVETRLLTDISLDADRHRHTDGRQQYAAALYRNLCPGRGCLRNPT